MQMLDLSADYLILWVTPSGQVESMAATWDMRQRKAFTDALEVSSVKWVIRRTCRDGYQWCYSVESPEERQLLLLLLEGHASPRRCKLRVNPNNEEALNDPRRQATMRCHPAVG